MIIPFFLGGRNLSALRREVALDSQDAALNPYGVPGADPYTRLGIVTPEMYDPMISGPRHSYGADYGGGSRADFFSFQNTYAFYRAIESLPKVASALAQRIDTTVERDWVVDAGGKDDIDVRAADAFREVMAGAMSLKSAGNSESPNDPMILTELSGLDGLQEMMLDALMMGFSAAEIIWDKEGALTYPRIFKFKHQHRFNMFLSNRGWEPRLLTREHPQFGIQLPQQKFIIHRSRPKFGPFGRGFGYELSPSYLDYLDALKFWLVHAQRYSSPTSFVEVPPNASDEMIQRARDAVENIGQEAAGTLPQGMTITTVEGKVGQSSTYKDLAQYLENQASQLILGQTGTLDQSGDGGSRSQDQVADTQTLRKSQKDSRQTCQMLRETLVAWFTRANFPGAKLPYIKRFYPELEEQDGALDTAKRDQILVSLSGRRLDDEYLESRYGVTFSDAAPENVPGGEGEEETETEQQGVPELSEGELSRNPTRNGWISNALEDSKGWFEDLANEIDTRVERPDRSQLDPVTLAERSENVYLVFHRGFRTAIVVSAKDANQAKARAKKRKSQRGSAPILKVRVATPEEEKAARAGRWVRSGPNGEKPGYSPSKRGHGPKPGKKKS